MAIRLQNDSKVTVFDLQLNLFSPIKLFEFEKFIELYRDGASIIVIGDNSYKPSTLEFEATKTFKTKADFLTYQTNLNTQLGLTTRLRYFDTIIYTQKAIATYTFNESEMKVKIKIILYPDTTKIDLSNDRVWLFVVDTHFALFDDDISQPFL